MFNKDYNQSAIRTLASGQLSPLKKVKHKVSYLTSSDESSNNDKTGPPNKQLRLLTLEQPVQEGAKADIPMKDLI